MILLANLMIGVGTVLSLILNVLLFFIIIRAVISWFSPDPYNPLVRFINSVTEPLLSPIRRRIPLKSYIDWSALIVIAVIVFLQSFLVYSLMDYAEVIKKNIM